MKISLISIVGVGAAALAFALFRWWRKWPVSNVCAVCGAKRLDGPQYGYSSHAEEDPTKMKPLCRQHLIAQLEIDYADYHEQALVITITAVLGTGRALPSGVPPVFTETKPPAWMMRSKALRLVTRSLMMGKAFDAPRLDGDGVAVLETPHVKLAGGGAAVAAVRNAVDDQRAHAADAFPAVGIKGNRLLAARDEFLVHHVEHLQEGHVRDDVPGLVGLEPAGGVRVLLPPNFESQVHL